MGGGRPSGSTDTAGAGGTTRSGGTAPVLAVRAAGVRADASLAVLDALVIIVAYCSILMARFDGDVPARYWNGFQVFLPLAVIVHLSSNWTWRLYGQMWRHASITEARRVLLAGASSAAALLTVWYVADLRVPGSVVVLGSGMATVLAGGVRFQARLFSVHREPGRRFGFRVAVIGAGEAGAAIIREMSRDPRAGLRPVALVDDDPRKRGRSIMGVRVVGGIDDLADVVARSEADQVLLAIPSATNELVGRAAAGAERAGVPLKVLPGVAELVRSQASVRDVRDVKIEDLLGRQQVTTDLDAVRQVLTGRRVLITGAGGSIGAEIVRQVAACAPALLVLLDHDETHLHDAVAGVSVPVLQVLADIRDGPRMREVFEDHRPELVFHAAAHKHVPVLEAHPREAVATNVVGTLNVVTAAAATGVERFVFISTDKAVRPSSVMGASKWLGEQIVLGTAPAGARYSAVRFGNVLGSRGSVIPTFARQIAANEPVTVTDARMTRFFMSIEEAVQLVLQAAVFSEGGEVFMLEMGEPVNILDLAKRMIRLSGLSAGTEIPIRITGVRPGEKLVEELTAPGEQAHATLHPSIVRLEPLMLPDAVLQEVLVRLAVVAAGPSHPLVGRLLVDVSSRPPEAAAAWLEDEMIDLPTLEGSVTWSSSTI